MQIPISETTFKRFCSIPEWLQDETLFSWASRYHAITGNRVSTHTCRVLFGHPKQGAQHDFPSRIDHLVAATNGLLGDAHSIIFTRTILPFFLHFGGEARAQSAVDSLRGENLRGLKFQLGVITSRFQANHPLKACPECLAQDEVTEGTAYWHVAHQYPGVWICPTHSQPLLVSTVKSTGVGRFLWHLPCHQTLIPTPLASIESPEESLIALGAFAELSKSLSSQPLERQFDDTRLHAVYKAALSRRGLTTSSGRLHIKETCRDYRAATRPLSVIPELAELYGTETTIEATLGRLLRIPRSGTHPLRHLALIYWLFSDWPSFLRIYDSNLPAPRKIESPPETQGNAKPQLRVDFCNCIDDGHSVTHCSKRLGITVTTGIAWAATHGVKVNRRPKALSDSILSGVTSSLRSGTDKKDVMAQYNLSATTINRILAYVEGLHIEWQNARFQKAQLQARSEWLNAISQMPSAGLKLLREQQPATYAWLYRNDRNWLDVSTLNLPKPTPVTRRGTVDWVARDTVLAEKVRVAAKSLQPDHAALQVRKRPIALWELYQIVPELRAKLDVLKKLPLTKQAINVAMQVPQQSDFFDAGDFA